MPDINKDLDRVNISEELSKTAAWKQLTFAENNSPISNASPGDAVDGKKRRRKRSRTTKPGPNVGKDSPQSNPKSPPVENNELIEMNGHTMGLPIEDTPFYSLDCDLSDRLSGHKQNLETKTRKVSCTEYISGSEGSWNCD